MSNLLGPDFITLLVRDIEVSRQFYSEVLGFKPSPEVQPNAVAFAAKPIGFAVRKSTIDLEKVPNPGVGILLWFHADNAAEFCKYLKEQKVPIETDITESPFGKMFTFRDPDGYLITVHDGG
jgi:catechol 2,3-dioxygenase-like lactoylglutathione lyase family enzyme